MQPVQYNPWIPHVHGMKYTKSQWQHIQLIRYFTDKPAATYKDAKLWINMGIYNYITDLNDKMKLDWSNKTLQQYCKDIRRDIRNNNVQGLDVDGYKFDYRKVAPIVDSIAFYLRGYSFMNILQVLDSLSQRDDIDCVWDDTKWNWGQCVMAIIAQSRKLTVFDMKYRCRKSQIQKECLIGSSLFFDDRNYVLNHVLINKMTSIAKYRLDTIKENRLKFDTVRNRLTLYDPKYDKDRYRSFDRYPKRVKQSIYDFWLDESRVDPAPSMAIITDHENKDSEGNKIREQVRYIRYTQFDFHKKWINKEGQRICDEDNCWVPSLITFIRLRPKQIRFEGPNDRTVSVRRFNYEQMRTAFITRTKGNHLCTTRFCENYAQFGENEVCECNDCTNCPLIKGVFEGDVDDTIHKIFCDNGKKWPDLSCIQGNCGKSDCGMHLLRGTLNKTFCRTFFVRPDAMISYDKIVTVKDTDDRSHHQIVSTNVTWSEFTQNLLLDVLPEFVRHSCAYQMGHHKRSTLSKNSDEKPTKLRAEQVFSSWDYISRIPIRSAVGVANGFGDDMSIAFLIIIQILNNHGKLIKSSHCFFSDAPQAGWQMAVAAAKRYYPISKQRVQDKNNVNAKMFINYSDGATKDFKNTSAVAFIGNIAIDNGVYNEWNVTAPEEGLLLHCDTISLNSDTISLKQELVQSTQK